MAPVAVGSEAVSAASHPLACIAAMEMYAQRGTAIDAGVAAAFALSVVEPYASGLGGHGCLLLHTTEAGTIGLDYLSACPPTAFPGMFKWVESSTLGGYRFQTEGDANSVGSLSTTLPTAVPAWCEVLAAYGTLPLSVILAPAIRFAETGFSIDATTTMHIAGQQGKLRQSREAASIWLGSDGRALAPGSIVKQPALAKTLRQLSVQGPDLFLSGEVGNSIASIVGRGASPLGSILIDPCRDIPALIRWGVPVRTQLRQWTIQSSPAPSTGGLAVCELLNILTVAGGETVGDAAWVHLFVESAKLAMIDRAALAGDPSVFSVDASKLTSTEFAAERARAIGRDRSGSYAAMGVEMGPFDDDTTHHSHMDKQGNVFVCTQSIGDPFGSGVVVPGTGLLLNNLMKLFDPRPGRRNSIRPGLKVFSSMAPTIVFEEGRPVLALGSPSGTRIISAVAYVLGLRLCRGISTEAAVEAPRIHWSGEELEVEADFDSSIIEELRRMGHKPLIRAGRDPWFGTVQAVEGANRMLRAVSDPRRAGGAAALSV